jgi:hypothetical protein
LLRLSSAAAGGNSTTSCQRRNFSGWLVPNYNIKHIFVSSI